MFNIGRIKRTRDYSSVAYRAVTRQVKVPAPVAPKTETQQKPEGDK